MANPIPNVHLRTPMFDGDMKALGNLSRLWSEFFANESGWISQGTHAERLATNPGSIPDGAFFIEKDRGAIYQSRFVGKDQAWVLVAAFMSGVLGGRPRDLGTNDVGFFYSATDALDYRWNGVAWATLDTVRGGSNLTHVGAIPKVSAAGTLTESPTTDDLTTLLTLLRNIGINHAAHSTVAGRAYITVQGSTLAGVYEVLTAEADADAVVLGLMQASDIHATGEKRAAIINFSQDGATANDRGGRIIFVTKADGGALSTWGVLTQAGFWGFGGNVTPAYPVDATGDANVSGVYRVDGTQVVSNQGAVLTASGAAIVGTAPATYALAIAFINTMVTLENNLKTRVDELEARLQAHGLIA